MWAWTQCAGHYIHIRLRNSFLWHVIALPQQIFSQRHVGWAGERSKGCLRASTCCELVCAVELCRAQTFGRALSCPRPSNGQSLEAVSMQLPAVRFSSVLAKACQLLVLVRTEA